MHKDGTRILLRCFVIAIHPDWGRRKPGYRQARSKAEDIFFLSRFILQPGLEMMSDANE